MSTRRTKPKVTNTRSERVRRLFRRLPSSETLSLILSAVLIGILTGFSAVAFDRLVHTMGTFVHYSRVNLGVVGGPLATVLIPLLGGLLVTPVVVRLSPDSRGSGIPSVMLAVSNMGGRVAGRIAVWRPLATTLSIGTGASLGTEGPVVQLGAAIASIVSSIFRLNDERRKSLVAVAAAGGIAATFNAPIAGVLFALEVILGQFGNRHFASVVIGAVMASAISRELLGPDPAFAVPLYELNSLLELPLYVLLGIVCAVAAIGFIRLVVGGEDLFNRLAISPWLRPAAGGLLIGLIALALPQVLGRGYDTTGAILSGRAIFEGGELVGVALLLVLALVKALATSVSLASWGSGGIFAPVLLIGAALGGAFGELAAYLFPTIVAQPGAFALVGMGAVFAGTTRSPMSTIVMIFELSGGYPLILPLLLAAVIATLIADSVDPESIYQVILSRKGLSLLRSRESDLLQTVSVREFMEEDIPTLRTDDTIKNLRDALANSHHHGFVLTSPDDPEHIAGIVTLSDVERARREGVEPQTPLRVIAHKTVHCALPDEPISNVLERMARLDIGRMPVVDPRDRRRAIGFVRQSNLARAYYQAVQRHRQLEEEEEARRLRDLTGQEIVEVRVRASCPLVGKTLKEAGLPQESIVVAIRRGGQTVFPHGDTKLEPGDTVVANVAPGFSPEFRAHFTAPGSRTWF